jgi:hypothetical protein
VVAILDHQVGWWEEGFFEVRLSAVRGGYKARIPITTFVKILMVKKGGLGS